MYSVQCRVSDDNKCEFQQSSFHGDCNFDATLVSKNAEVPKKLKFLRCCQDDVRSPTQVRHKKKETRSRLAECESFETRQFCQAILVQLIQCVNSVRCVSFNPSRASKRPAALVYQNSWVLRDVRIIALQTRHRVLSWALSSTSQCSRSYSLPAACFSFSYSSLFSRHGPFIVPNAGFTQFCTRPSTGSFQFHILIATATPKSFDCLPSVSIIFLSITTFLCPSAHKFAQ